MSAEQRAKNVVDQMLKLDGFSAWLGIQVLDLSPGNATLKMVIRKEMLNGFERCHGGVPYAFADSALAFASNSHGRKSVALENSISYPAPVMEGDELTAVAKEIHLGNTVASYDVTITNQHQRKVALFRGMVYRLKDEW